MPYLNSVTTTQEIEFEIDLIDLAYDHIDSIDDLKELLQGISSNVVDNYNEELVDKAKDEIYDSINDADELAQFIDNIGDSITDEYRQRIIESGGEGCLTDAIASANEKELQEALAYILKQRSMPLHLFLTTNQHEVKLAFIHGSQALVDDLCAVI